MEPLLIGLFGAVFFAFGFWAGMIVEQKINTDINDLYGSSDS